MAISGVKVQHNTMSATVEKHEQQYNEIVKLYDIADKIVGTVEHPKINEPETQLKVVEPLVMQIEETADVLTEEYINVLKTDGVPAPQTRSRVETALRKMHAAIYEYNKKTAERTKRIYKNVYNMADPLVNELKQLIEKITTVFMELVQLSIEKILPKWELEEMKHKQSGVALKLHEDKTKGK